MEHRQTQLDRERVGLVEAPSPSARAMQGHRHDKVGIFEQLATGRSNQCRQTTSEGGTAFILQCVDNRSERAFIEATGSPPTQTGGRAEATHNPLQAQTDSRQTASVAHR